MTNAELVALLERMHAVLWRPGCGLGRDIKTAITALRSGEVVLCPKEPTEEMIDAAFNATVWPDLNRATTATVIIGLRHNMRLEYRAMLACAKGKP